MDFLCFLVWLHSRWFYGCVREGVRKVFQLFLLIKIDLGWEEGKKKEEETQVFPNSGEK